jgi:WD40 repeat protein/tetratricopeptide (TPR) repeat protein
MLHRALVHIAQFSPEGRRLLVSTFDGIVRLWDAQTGLPLSEPLPLGNLQFAQFSPDGQRILVLTGWRRLLLLDARPTRAAARFLQNEQPVRMAGFSPDDSQLLCVNFGPTAMLWNLRTHPAVPIPLRHAQNINSAEFSPNGQLIATAGEDKVVRLWGAETGRIVGEPILQESSVNSVQFDVPGKRLMIGATDGTVRVWEIESGNAVGRPIKHSSPVRAAAFSSDGQYAITQAQDNAVRIWRLGLEPTLLRELRHEGAVGFLKSMDGKRLATFSVDQTARVWDSYSDTPVSPVLKHNDAIVTAGFGPDGRRLVTGCRDGTARSWDLASGKSVVMLHEGTVKVAWFNPDGCRIVTGCDDGVARLWDADSGQPVSEPLPQKSDINSARFTSDGQWLATVSADGVARIWPVLRVTNAAPAWLPDLAEAVANKRLIERRVVLTADDQAIWRVRQAVAASTRDDEFTSWAKWFFAPRELRPFCPGACLTHADWVEECLNAASPQSLQEALQAAPTEPLPIASLVLSSVAAPSTKSVALAGADWLSHYATQRWPNYSAVWKAQAKVLRRKGNFQEALQALQHALDLQPEPSLCLLKSQMLEDLGKLGDAALACVSGLRMLSNSPVCSSELRQRLGFQRINALRQLGQQEEAITELAALKLFPGRDPQAPTNTLDLTLCFNARFDEDWHRHTDKGNNLASLPPGLHSMGGTIFDLRGIVQLAALRRDLDPLYPEKMRAIRVGRQCRRLHFLHGAGWVTAEGTTIAHWVIHWADGQEESVPVVYGRDVRNWTFWPTMPTETGGAQPVWKGPQARWKNTTESGVRRYQSTWQNPRLDVPVASIDFVSTGAASAPFLLAITAE